MYEMRKMLCSKLKLSFFADNKGTREKEEDRSSLMRNPSVREEYVEAFRTKSYIEISNKVEGHLLRLPSPDEDESAAAASSSSPPPPPYAAHHIHLSEYLLEPYQKPSPNTSNFHQFFSNYFEISLEASRICESLLANINQARRNHLRIKKAIKISRRISDATTNPKNIDEYHVMYKNLAAFAAQRNPFSTTTAEKFLDLREAHVLMYRELTSTCRKLRKRTKTIKKVKKTLAVLLLMGLSALVVVALVLVVHFPAGLVAAAPLALLIKTETRRLGHNCDERWLEGLASKLDVAARGVFIMINDFATMSRIVKRLEDEIEHRRFVADVCVRKGKKEALKEVVREFQMHESCFVEQLEELEKQICLCFLDIDRSKRLLLREMVK